MRQSEAVVPPPFWESFFFSLRDAKSSPILEVFWPGRQILDDPQGVYFRTPNPRRSWVFRSRCRIWASPCFGKGPKTTEKLRKMCWGKTVQIERIREVKPRFRHKSHFCGCPRASPQHTQHTTHRSSERLGASGPHHRCFPAFSRLPWAEHQRFMVMTFTKVKKHNNVLIILFVC